MHSYLRDHCGIVVCHSVHDTYKAMKALQHRGQDTAGMAAKNKSGIDILRWQGLVDSFSLDSIHKLLKGDVFIGHVRYATYGGKDKDELFMGAHPRFADGTVTAKYIETLHPHLIARGATKSIVHNGTIPGLRCAEGEIDTDVMLRAYSKHGVGWVMERIPAAYSAAILDMQKDEVIACRDRHGIRPLWVGEKDGRIVIASEDVAIWDIGGRPIREVRPGEAIYVNSEGSDFKSEQIVDPFPVVTDCFFEYNYNSGLSSSLDGSTINSVCYMIGVEAAREYAPGIDIVTYIPNRPKPMALGYADARKIPLAELFYKVKKERAFLGPTKKTRAQSIGENLFVVDNVDIRGKRVGVFDDSHVRGNNAPDASRKLRAKGAAWLALILGTPPIGPVIDNEYRGCLFGVDMPPNDDFVIRRYGSLEELRAASGYDEIHYISKEAMARAHGVDLSRRCTYCIGGPNPLSEDEMRGLESLEI